VKNESIAGREIKLLFAQLALHARLVGWPGVMMVYISAYKRLQPSPSSASPARLFFVPSSGEGGGNLPRFFAAPAVLPHLPFFLLLSLFGDVGSGPRSLLLLPVSG